MMRTIVAAFLMFLPVLSYGACQELLKLEATVDLEKKSWETIELEKEKSKVCVSLDDKNANLEIVFRKDKKEFKTRIYSSLEGYYDYQDEKKKMTGGKFPIRYVFLDTWAPDWIKGSTVKVSEIGTKNVIVEAKL